MNFKLKTLVAAAALAVVASQASAFTTSEQSVTGSGLVFYAYNETGPTSFVQDLGKVFTNFSPAANNTTANNFSVNVASTAWTSYLASVGGDLSTTFWGVFSAKQNGGYGLMTTIRDGEDINFNFDSKSSYTVGAINTPLRNAILALNAATNAATYYSASAAADNFFQGTGHDYAGKVGFDTDNAVGTSSSFLYMNPAVSNNLVTTTYANADGVASTFSFDGTAVSFSVAPVAAVPEPGELAMLISGLMMVGGIAARRRKSSK